MRKILALSFCLLSFIALSSQELPEVIPPSPEAASLGKFSEIPISHYTGVPNISIPITSFSVGNKTFPFSINYHARGIQVSEIASRVGLGWALNAGGSITRQVRHKPDDCIGGLMKSGNILSQSLSTGDFFFSESVRSSYGGTLYGRTIEVWDRLPDNFIIQASGISAKFIHDYTDGEPLIQQFGDNKVETIIGDNPADGLTSDILGYIVTDKDGFKYYFGVSEDGAKKAADFDKPMRTLYIDHNGYTQMPGSDDAYYYNTWHLMEIKSPNGDTVSFNYTKEILRYFRRSHDESNSSYNTNISNEIEQHQWQLSSIEHQSTRVEFIEDTSNREDLRFGHTLSKIEIYHDNNFTKAYELNHSYQNTQANGINYTNNILSALEPEASKRLFLDGIVEIGQNNATKPATEFIYNDEVLPNRFSNAQDFWGYFNGAKNGQFLPLLNYYYYFNGHTTEVHPYTDITKNRTIDTLKSMAGILERIKYPTGGSTKFIYEHNRGKKGMDLNGIDLPDINPVHDKNKALAFFNHQAYDGDKYYSDPFFVNGPYGDMKITVNLPHDYAGANQNIACGNPQQAECRFNITIEGLNGAPSYHYIFAGEQEFEVVPGEYRIVFDPLDDPNWIANPDDYTGDIFPYTFSVYLNWKEKEFDEDELLFASGKRIKKVEQYDTNDQLITFKEYDYKDPMGEPSGVILGLSSFTSTRKFPTTSVGGTTLSNGPLTFVEPYGAIPGSPLSTYQGNTIGYSNVIEYVGDKTNNIGKTEYTFTNYKDNGGDFAHEMSVDNAGNPDSHTSFPYLPPNDFEWLRGIPKYIKYYETEGNGTYKIVKSIKNEYMFGGQPFPSGHQGYPSIFSAPTLRLDLDEDMTDPNLMYIKNRAMFRLPLVHLYFAFDDTPGLFDNEHMEYKIFHLTGGTVNQHRAIETLYDANEQPTIVTESKTDFNYQNHYQPSSVTTITSDGKAVMQDYTYPQDIVSTYTIHPDNYSTDPITALAEQHRFVPIETKTYKDLNNDGYIGFPQNEDILSSTITEYDWFSTNTQSILEPKRILTSKSNDVPEERIAFHKYDKRSNPLELSKTEGTRIIYVWGYNDTQPIAKLENASYDNLSTVQQTAINAVKLASNNDIDAASEEQLRVALSNLSTAFPEAMVSTYTYDPLIGVTSMTDPKGQTIYYHYDDFNRLKHVKDKDGNILSENDYNYKQN